MGTGGLNENGPHRLMFEHLVPSRRNYSRRIRRCGLVGASVLQVKDLRFQKSMPFLRFSLCLLLADQNVKLSAVPDITNSPSETINPVKCFLLNSALVWSVLSKQLKSSQDTRWYQEVGHC